jgi:hypothetical protein
MNERAFYHPNRRTFLKTVGAIGVGTPILPLLARPEAVCGNTRQASDKPPYRVIFSNDTTNILSCVSPYHKKGELWRPEMLEATVDEVAPHGVDAHFIQLASGQVPWYRSKVYPMEEHHRWWQEHFGVDPENDAFNVGGVHRYILDGGDPLQVFIDRCRLTGQAPFISMRLNDAHHLENVNTPGNTRGIHSISRFYADHPEWRIGDDLTKWNERTLNWAVPEVREWIFSLIAEQCLSYDIDGFELDFMRMPYFFRQDETGSDERSQIMTAFVRRVRRVLDEGSRGKRCWLCARVPCYTSAFDPLGIDLKAWRDVGLDMVNVSPFYFTVQQTDLPRIRAAVPEAAVYLEMCHSIWNGKRIAKGYDAFTFRRTTPEQYETTAHLAYAQGADGVSLFNFVYYREHGNGERGPFNEPPFGVIDHLGDPQYLARQPQHWFIAQGWRSQFGGERITMPQKVGTGSPLTMTLELASPAGGWQKDGRFRLQASEPLDGTDWSVSLNGVALTSSSDTSEPYDNPYPPMLGEPAMIRAWGVPASLPKGGRNSVTITLTNGTGAKQIDYIDLAII